MGRRSDILARIASRSAESDDGCLLWLGGTSGKGRGGGYGRISLDGGTMATHIVVWICEHGPIPPGKQIDHLCNNRLCVRLAHLEMVTHLKNQRRRAERAKLKRAA